MADPADQSPDESHDHASRPAAAPAPRPWEATDALEAANGEGLTRARTAGFEGHSALEFAAAFDAGCAAIASELEGAAAKIGWAEALRCAQACGQRDVGAWVPSFCQLVTLRH